MFTKIIHNLMVFTILFFIMGCSSDSVDPISSNTPQSAKNDYHAYIKPKDTIEKDIVYHEEAKIEEPIDSSNNTPPIAYSQSLRVNKNGFISFCLNGKDKDNDKLIYRLVKQPEHGVLNQWGDSKNSGMYIPDHDYYGEDSFTFVINDGCVDSKEVCVSIKIQNVKRVIPYYNPARVPDICKGKNTFNSNFEGPDGLSGWDQGGNVVIEETSLVDSNQNGVYIPLDSFEGQNHVLLKAEGISIADAADALGVKEGDINDASNGKTGTDGSYISTSICVHKGDVITVKWNFINAETEVDAQTFDDFGVAVIGAALNGEVEKLQWSSELADDGTNYPEIEASGWQTFTYTATKDGSVDLGMAVFNAIDYSIDSYMMVDAVKINGQDPN